MRYINLLTYLLTYLLQTNTDSRGLVMQTEAA